jgi:hypothetical protein
MAAQVMSESLSALDDQGARQPMELQGLIGEAACLPIGQGRRMLFATHDHAARRRAGRRLPREQLSTPMGG